MKAQHVVTGRDRDRAYSGIFGSICFAVIGLAVIGAGAWLPGLIILVVSLLCILGAAQRLRGEI